MAGRLSVLAGRRSGQVVRRSGQVFVVRFRDGFGQLFNGCGGGAGGGAGRSRVKWQFEQQLGHRFRTKRTDLRRRGHHRLFARQPKAVHPGLQEEESLQRMGVYLRPALRYANHSGATPARGQPASSTSSPVGSSSFRQQFDVRPRHRLQFNTTFPHPARIHSQRPTRSKPTASSFKRTKGPPLEGSGSFCEKTKPERPVFRR